MKAKAFSHVFFVSILALALAVSARPDGRDGNGKDRDRDGKDRDSHEQECRDSEHHDHELNTPVGLGGVISVPGTPLVSTDISWVDPGTEKLYLADRSNFGVDVIDIETNTWLGRIGGFVGPNTPPPHMPAPPNGQGPNGVVVTPGRLLFAGDGNSNLQVADVDPSNLSTYLKIIQTISTADPECDSGSVHQCNRADEVGWDERDKIIMVANDAPTHGTLAVSPYASFYQEVNPTTYTFLGRVFFPGAGGLEQPVWDPETRRFLVTVPGTASQKPGVAVIDPHHLVTPLTPQYLIDCAGLGFAGQFGATGEVLGPFQHLLVSACGNPIILDALTGHVIKVITQVGGGDEVAFNSGDGRFYVTSTDKSGGPLNGTTVLGVIDAETSTWLQNFPDPGGKAPEAFAENNHIFTTIQISSAVAGPPYSGTIANDTSTCALFGMKGRGCIAVFAHGEEISQK